MLVVRFGDGRVAMCCSYPFNYFSFRAFFCFVDSSFRQKMPFPEKNEALLGPIMNVDVTQSEEVITLKDRCTRKMKSCVGFEKMREYLTRGMERAVLFIACTCRRQAGCSGHLAIGGHLAIPSNVNNNDDDDDDGSGSFARFFVVSIVSILCSLPRADPLPTIEIIWKRDDFFCA